MNQWQFDQLPLLLRRQHVMAVLEGVNRRALLEAIDDGSLRFWPPAPAPRHRRYYLKADVAGVAGLEMRAPTLQQLTAWMWRQQLLQLLGVGEAFWETAIRDGLLACEREGRPPWRLRLRLHFFCPPQTGSANIDAGRILAMDGMR